MSPELALVAWAACGAALAHALAVRIRSARRLELVARACHEVAGPLTAARLGLDAAAAGGPPAPERLAAVGAELRRAGLALEDLHAARQGRTAGDRRERLDLAEVAREAAEAWRPVAEVHGARLELVPPPGPAWVVGDDRRLARAVGNLVANAIEHGGGKVRLAVVPATGGVRLEVADDGPGLAAAPSVLARRARHGRGRRGRGLAIVAETAARHGGRLVAAPSARGARVAIELPSVS